MILCIETATNICSVSLCHGGKIIASRESSEERSHASLLTVFIIELLEEASIKASGLEAIAVSKGPGSYTGLRIGVSTAKGIAYGAGIPLVGVNTLEAMFSGISSGMEERPEKDRPTLFCPMIDARRMEVYYSLFDASGKSIVPTTAGVITGESFSEYLEDSAIIFFGNGSAKVKELINNPNATFIDDFNLSARYLCKPATIAVNNKNFEDIAYFEPYYLKEFIATVPKDPFQHL